MAKAKKAPEKKAGKSPEKKPPGKGSTAVTASGGAFVDFSNVTGMLQDVKNPTIVRDITTKLIKEYQIAEVTRPEDVPKFPADPTKLSSEDVGRYYSVYESEVAWIRYKLAEVEVQLDYVSNILNTVKEALFLSYRAEHSRDEATAWVNLTRDVNSTEKYLLQLRMEKRLLDARYDIFGKYAASMSREITRRKQDDEGFNQGSRGSAARNSKVIKGKDLDPVSKLKHKVREGR